MPEPVLPPPLSPSAEQIEKLRALALAAISGYPMDTDECTGAWKAWFNFHGDPHVVEDGESSGVVAVVSTAPLDYGKARAEFMGAADPLTLLSLLDSLAAERALRVQAEERLKVIRESWDELMGRSEA